MLFLGQTEALVKITFAPYLAYMFDCDHISNEILAIYLMPSAVFPIFQDWSGQERGKHAINTGLFKLNPYT